MCGRSVKSHSSSHSHYSLYGLPVSYNAPQDELPDGEDEDGAATGVVDDDGTVDEDGSDSDDGNGIATDGDTAAVEMRGCPGPCPCPDSSPEEEDEDDDATANVCCVDADNNCDGDDKVVVVDDDDGGGCLGGDGVMTLALSWLMISFGLQA